MANEILFFAVVIVFAANAFLYYRWKALKETIEEKHADERMGFAKEMLNTFYGTPAPRSHGASEETLLGEAKAVALQLRGIAENDLVELHQKLVATDEKVSQPDRSIQ